MTDDARPSEDRLREALEPCFSERTDCVHGQWDAVTGDHFGEHLRAALDASRPSEDRLREALDEAFAALDDEWTVAELAHLTAAALAASRPAPEPIAAITDIVMAVLKDYAPDIGSTDRQNIATAVIARLGSSHSPLAASRPAPDTRTEALIRDALFAGLVPVDRGERLRVIDCDESARVLAAALSPSKGSDPAPAWESDAGREVSEAERRHERLLHGEPT